MNLLALGLVIASLFLIFYVYNLSPFVNGFLINIREPESILFPCRQKYFKILFFFRSVLSRLTLYFSKLMLRWIRLFSSLQKPFA